MRRTSRGIVPGAHLRGSLKGTVPSGFIVPSFFIACVVFRHSVHYSFARPLYYSRFRCSRVVVVVVVVLSFPWDC